MKLNLALRIWLVVAGAIPWLLIHAAWANAVLVAYSMTAVLFGILLIDEFPPVGSAQFWRAVIPTTLVHLALVMGLVVFILKVPSINQLPRIVFGLLGIIVAIEFRVALRIIHGPTVRSN